MPHTGQMIYEQLTRQLSRDVVIARAIFQELLRPYFGVPAAYGNEAGTQACEFNSSAMVRLRLPRLLLDPCFMFDSKPMLPGERRTLMSARTALSSTILLLEAPRTADLVFLPLG
jgi:hypothetical protein